MRAKIGDLYPNIGELGISQELGGKDGQLQGTTGLAEGNRLGDGSLSSNQEVSAGGEIRTDISDSKGSNINTSKYTEGMGQRFNQKVHLSSQSSEGFSDGIGNSSDSLSTSGLSGQNQVTTISAGNNQFGENAQFTNQQSQQSNITEQQLSLFSDSSNSQLPTPNSQSPKLTPVAYLWTRTVKCPNPECGADVPLVRQTWLCKKSKKYVALKISPNYQTKKVEFKVVEATTAKDLGFDPSLGISRGSSTCHHCGTTIKNYHVKAEGKAGRIGHQLMAIVCTTPNAQGKTYLSANDFQQYIPNEEAIKQRLEKLCQDTGLTILNEPIFSGDTRTFFTHLYGLDNFGELFTSLQLLSLMTFVKWVRLAYEEMMGDSVMANGDGVIGNNSPFIIANKMKQSQSFLSNEGIALGKESYTDKDSTGNTSANDKENFKTALGDHSASLREHETAKQDRASGFGIDQENSTSNNPNDNAVVSKTIKGINSNNHGDNIVKDSIFKTGNWQSEEEKQEFAKVVTTYLGILCDCLTDYNTSIAHCHNTREVIRNTFARQALPMVWDFSEINPIGNASGNTIGALQWITFVLNREGNNKGILDQAYQLLKKDEKKIIATIAENISKEEKETAKNSNNNYIALENQKTNENSDIKANKTNNNQSNHEQNSPHEKSINYGKVYRGSSMSLPLEKKYLDAIVTDPPYFDSVLYADLSDYFYVWFKRSIGHLYPEHFSSQLTPKKQEAIMEPSRHGGDKQKASQAYEDMMHQAFREGNRVLKDDGIIIIVYAHKTTSGWTTLIDFLRRAIDILLVSWKRSIEDNLFTRGGG